jgi:ATP-dependent DNA helicase DinG
LNAAALLGPDGPLAREMPGYEVRPGQLAMAEAVERALGEDRILLCEAGTGTGKTMAYLVPAILSGRKVIVSTATRQLQEQIFWKDLPLIERTLGLRPEAALMKGLSNYLCRRRFSEFRRSEEAGRPSVSSKLGMIERWAEGSDTGDFAELVGLGEDDPVLSAIASSSDTRIGPSCQFHGECFVTRMKREAESARIVVVNHHLFFADLALRGAHPGRVLPDYDAVIFDEAHQLEDVATMFFGVRVSEGRITRLLGDLERGLAVLSQDGSLFGGSIVPRARNAAAAFFGRVVQDARAMDGRATLDPDFWHGPPLELWHALDDALDGVRALAEQLRGTIVEGASPLARGRRDALLVADGLELAARRADDVRQSLATIVDGANGRVSWVDTGGRVPALSSSPVDLSTILRARLFDVVPSVVLTSATLSSASASAEGAQGFAFIRSRLGLDEVKTEVREQMVASPFDYAARSMLYVPRDLPEPASGEFLERAADRISELIEITGGGAFVLTTSLRSMKALHRILAARFSARRVLIQTQGPKNAVLATFRAAGDAVLVATASFWQGVDVPGDALRLVVLEKIPFPMPNEPVILARARALEEQGKKPFVDLHVPLAKIALKQGFGRLIRARTDRGIVALLDDRIHRRGYGKGLLNALPPARRTHELDEVRAFWAELDAPPDRADAEQPTGAAS